jgi:hypothetical protein
LLFADGFDALRKDEERFVDAGGLDHAVLVVFRSPVVLRAGQVDGGGAANEGGIL